MMDTQRLIAFVVFSFSALMLWEAWQKHNAPKPPVPTTASAPIGVPQPSKDLGAGVPAAPGLAPAKPAAAAVRE